jgi:SAM-dependent methyltransferase
MSRPTTSGSFDRLAPDYDDLRPVDDAWWQVFEAIVAAADVRGRRLLEVGCGTGRLAAALSERGGARVWAVEQSEAMAAEARRNGVHVKVAAAERLPFRAGWFERAVMRMVAHLLDRPLAFAELRRVLADDGRLVVATMDPETFGDHWLVPWFPAILRIDGTRFPTAEQLDSELRDAGFEVRVDRLVQENAIERERALAKFRGRAFSTFDLLDEDEFRAGLAEAEARFPPRLAYRTTWLIVAADAR